MSLIWNKKDNLNRQRGMKYPNQKMLSQRKVAQIEI